jgi:starch synthase
MYPENTDPTPSWDELLQHIFERPEIFNAKLPADDWIEKYKGSQPQNFLCSIGRVVDQKVPLFLEPVNGYDSALEAILATSGPDSLFIMLGSGERELEDRFVEIARQHDNFVYLRGYVESLSAPLYSMADLFLMPSSFEPCGISQMLSMRAGHPCVVHAVGGLKDTVDHAITGFIFEGKNPVEQATNFVICVQNALSIKLNKPTQWKKICSNAAGQRFSWEVAATTYIQKLYQFD